MVDTEWLFILTTTVALGVSITDMAFERVVWTRNFQQESIATELFINASITISQIIVASHI